MSSKPDVRSQDPEERYRPGRAANDPAERQEPLRNPKADQGVDGSMSRRKVNQGPVLRERKPRYDASGKLTHRGTFYIDDIGAEQRQTQTGCSFGDDREYAEALEAAQLKLYEYGVAKYTADKAAEIPASIEPQDVVIGDLILFYLTKKAKKIAAMEPHRRREHLSQIECLQSYWGEKRVIDINEDNSLEYQEGKKQSVVRNKIIVLKGIITYAAKQSRVRLGEDQLDYAQPERNHDRIDYYEMQELIALYKAARRKRTTWHENRKQRLEDMVTAGKSIENLPVVKCQRVSGHIAKYILVAAWTGTRAEKICTASFVQEIGRPWIDLEKGIFYRKPLKKGVPPNKRADPVLLPDRLLLLMRKWHHVDGCQYLIEYHGRAVDCRKGFYTLKNQVLPPERAKVLNRHSLKHTAVTFLLKEGVSIESVAHYVSTTPEVIRSTYSQLIPGEFSEVHKVLNRKGPRKPRPGEKAREKEAA
jgi:hypothetical protein